MAYFAVSGRQTVEISSFDVEVKVNGKTISVYTRINSPAGNSIWSDTSIADILTLKPIYRSSNNSDKQYHIKYGTAIEGDYHDKRSNKNSQIRDKNKGDFFDSFIYPYLLGALPLTSGYKVILPVYEYKPEAKSMISNTRITEVKSSMYRSEITGEHAVWQVSVFEEGTNVKYEYYIDKESRKLWKVEILASNGKQYLLVDKELDYNPFTAIFDKDQTYKMVSAGSGTISGQIYARDNQNSLKGIAILNINKKQYAQQGTTVILIPYTDYFKEWVSLNEKLRKKGRAVPISKEAAECIKITSVYDNDGNFEFTNLMPGEYYLFTEFGYTHTASRTEVVGYTDIYINGFFQGSTANTEVYKYNTNVKAAVKKIVTIKKEGDKVTVKLKKTL
ncbi:MAG: hypothetical protein E6Q24_01395 [Chitinophagaceae bacterium]|jgi:hypothetical protein|nr:MAG: hypothetical protein BGO52_06505 [Sphingobacteriales bacterium 44-61]TXJ29452.1 MAG: hypothetical protein E6Q24_01395 [Chitinophagaceae bacterium]